jgi:hypothetical protein
MQERKSAREGLSSWKLPLQIFGNVCMHVYSVQYRARVYKSEISLLVQFSRTFVNTKEEALPSKLKREFPVSRVVLEKLLDMC